MPSKQDFTAKDTPIDQLTQRQDYFGWTVPVEQIPLPSSGIIYPKESVLHNKETLQIKAMTAHEEDIIMSRALIKEGTVITHLIKSCIIDKSVNVDEMLLGDRNSLLVAIRITGYGSKYNSNTICGACNTSQLQTFDLSDLEIRRLNIKPIKQGINEFEFILPITKKRVTFKFLTVSDEHENEVTASRRQKLMPDIKVDNSITSQLTNQILTIDGSNDRSKIAGFIGVMPAGDSKALRKFILNSEPGIDMSVNMTCSRCSESSKIGLALGAEFFWPK